MNEPIISPAFVYLIGRLDMIHNFSFVVGLILTVATAIFVMLVLSDITTFIGDIEDGNKMFLNFLKKLACIALIVDALAVFVPTKTEAIAMYVANYVTPASIKSAGDSADKIVDKLVDKILKESNKND